MLAQEYRLTTKDVRYIQKQKNIVWTQHFGFLWIRQYPNRKFHQCSLYIAADTVKKSVRRHQLKRKLLVQLEQWLKSSEKSVSQFYKLFIFLNKKNVSPTLLSWQHEHRRQAIDMMTQSFTQEWSLARKKLWIL